MDNRLSPDADANDQDWIKSGHWDLPEYGSDEFNDLLKFCGITLDEFKNLPVYKFAVKNGIIKEKD